MSLHREIIVAEAYGNIIAYVRKNLKVFTMLPPTESLAVAVVARETFVHVLEDSGLLTISNAKTGLIVKRWRLELEGTPHAMCIPRANSSMAWLVTCEEGTIRIYCVSFQSYACYLQYTIDYDVDIKHLGRLFVATDHLALLVHQPQKTAAREYLSLITVRGAVQTFQGALKEHSVIGEGIKLCEFADRNANLVTYIRHDDPIVYFFDMQKHSEGPRRLKATSDYGHHTALHVNEAGTLLAAASDNGKTCGLYWWNLESGKGRELSGLTVPVCKIASTSTLLVCILYQTGWTTIDIVTGVTVKEQALSFPVRALSRFFTRDNKVFAVVDKDAHLNAGGSPAVFSFPLEEGDPNFDQTYFWFVNSAVRWRNQVIIDRAQKFTNVVTLKGHEGSLQISGPGTGHSTSDGDQNLIYHALLPNGILLYHFPGVDVQLHGPQNGIPSDGAQLTQPAGAVIGVLGNFLVYQYYGKAGFQVMNLVTRAMVFDVEYQMQQPSANLFKTSKGMRVVFNEYNQKLHIWDLMGQDPDGWSSEPTLYQPSEKEGVIVGFTNVESLLYVQLLAIDGYRLLVWDTATGRKKMLDDVKRFADIDHSGLIYLLTYNVPEQKFVAVFLDGKSGALLCQFMLEKQLWIGCRSGNILYGTYGDRTTMVTLDFTTGEMRPRISVPATINHVVPIPDKRTLLVVAQVRPVAYEIGMDDENALFPKHIEHALDHEKFLITYSKDEAAKIGSRRRRCLTWCHTKQNDCRVVRYRGLPVLQFFVQFALFAYAFFQLVCFNFYNASLHGTDNVDLAAQVRGWGPTIGYVARISTAGSVTLLLLLLMTFGDQLERLFAFSRAESSSPFLEPMLWNTIELFLVVTCSISANAVLTVFTDAYPCDTVDGVSVLAADHSILCNSAPHITSMVFASICLALYVPLTLRSLRCNNRFKLLEKKYWYHIFYSPYDAPFMDEGPLQPFGRGSQRSYGNMVFFLTKAFLNIIRVALLLRPVRVAIGNSVVGLVHLSGTTTLETFHHPLVNSANCALGIALEISYLVNIAYVNGNLEQRTANVVIASCAVCVGLVVFVIHALVTRKRARKPVKLERATTPLRWLSVPSGSDSRSGSAESTSDWGSLPASKTGSDSASLKFEASGSKSGSAASSVKSSGSGSRSSGSHSGESSS